MLERAQAPRKQLPFTEADIARFEAWKAGTSLGETITKLRDLGKAEAERDIKTGHLRLLDCGNPFQFPKIDEKTGYRIDWIASCGDRNFDFDTEVRAYNDTMLQWHATHTEEKPH